MSFSFYLRINNNTIIPSEGITSFNYHVNIHNMYSGASLSFQDLENSQYNEIGVGTPVDIVFYDLDSRGKEYTNKMKIIAFHKTAIQKGVYNPIVYSLTLISDWYFNDNLSTGAYFGKAGEIIEGVCKTVFFPTVKNSEILDFEGISEEGDRRALRYQLNQRSQDFIRSILPYAYAHETFSPFFLFSTEKGTLKLRSFSNMINIAPQIELFSKQGYSLPNTKAGMVQKNLLSFVFNGDIERSASSYKVKLATDGFYCPGKSYSSEFILSNPENNNLQSFQTSPTRSSNKGWQYHPADAIGLSISDFYKENLATFSIDAVFNGFYLDNISVGSTVKVYLPFNNAINDNGYKVNLGEGTYLVEDIEYIKEESNVESTLKDLAELSFITKVRLVQCISSKGEL